MQIVKDVKSSGINYVDSNDVLHIGATDRGVLLSNASQISILDNSLFVPGDTVHTAGWQNAWEMSPAGTWAIIIGG